MSEKTKTFENRKARHDFTIVETLEVGVMLKGWEVKAIRAARLNMKGGWVRETPNGWVWFSEITALEQASTHVTPTAWDERKILMSKAQGAKWQAKVKERGFTVVPLRGYFKGPWFKLEIALAKGKQEQDKRASEKDATTKKEVAQAMKTMFKKKESN